MRTLVSKKGAASLSLVSESLTFLLLFCIPLCVTLRKISFNPVRVPVSNQWDTGISLQDNVLET